MKIVVKDWKMLSIGERLRILELKVISNQFRFEKMKNEKTA